MARVWVWIVGCIASLSLIAGAGAAVNGTVSLTARLVPGQEVPQQSFHAANAFGHFVGALKPTKKGYRLTWRLTFTRLSGRATSAYIHRGKPGRHGAAWAHLCSPCASGVQGNTFFSSYELALARQGDMYVNVRTVKNPAGEIRGQIMVK